MPIPQVPTSSTPSVSAPVPGSIPSTAAKVSSPTSDQASSQEPKQKADAATVFSGLIRQGND